MRCFSILVLAALVACAPNTPPTVVAGSDASVVLFRQGQHTLQEAFAAADQHCRARSRSSTYIRTERIDDNSVRDVFECRAA